MAAQGMKPGWAEGREHLPTRSEVAVHDPQDCRGVLEVLERVEGDHDVRWLVARSQEAAASGAPWLVGLAPGNAQPRVSNVDPDDAAGAAFRHFNSLCAGAA